MKNVSRVALAVCVALGLVACKSNDNHKSSSVPTPVPVNFVEEAKKENVKAAIGKIQDNDAATNKTATEVKAVNQGEKITAHHQTYASYVAVLSKKDETKKEYDVDYAVKLDQPTKETETFKLESLDATYKGKLTSTDLNKDENNEDYLETNSYDVTFTVKEKHISGLSLAEEGKIKTTFEKTAINVKESGLDFAGRLKVEEFGNDEKEKKLVLEHTYGGTYAGMFGGANAEEIAGTFKADKGEFKGAFAAKKEVKEPAAPAPAGVQGGQ